MSCAVPGDPVLETMENGMSIITKENRGSNIASVVLAVKAGSIFESEENNGISSLLEKVLFKKSSGYDDIPKVIDSFGGQFFSTANRDFTVFSVTVNSDKVPAVIDLFSNAIAAPVITEEMVQSSRADMLAGLASASKNPRAVITREYMKHAYTVHPYRLSPSGTPSSVKHISLQEIKDYFSSLYIPGNMAVVVAGDIDRHSVVSQCRNAFSGFSGNPVMAFSWKAEPQKTSKTEIELSSKTTEDAAVVAVGWHSPGIRNSDTFAMDIILQSMTRGISARLNYQLGEKMQSVYWTWGNYVTSREPGSFILYATCEPSQARQVKEKILKEIDVLRRDSITPKELKKAKVYFLSGAVYDNESLIDYTYSLAFWSINEDFHFAENYLKNIQSVTLQDVQRVAQTYLTDDSYTSVILYPETWNGRR